MYIIHNPCTFLVLMERLVVGGHRRTIASERALPGRRASEWTRAPEARNSDSGGSGIPVQR